MVRRVLGPLDARGSGTTYDVWLAVMGLPRLDDMLGQLRVCAALDAEPVHYVDGGCWVEGCVARHVELEADAEEVH